MLSSAKHEFTALCSRQCFSRYASIRLPRICAEPFHKDILEVEKSQFGYSVCRIERAINEDVVLVRGHSSVIPVARWERVGSVGVNVLNFPVTAVNDEASVFPFSHRLAKFYSVFLACELLSGLISCGRRNQPLAGFRYDVQSPDDVANPRQVNFPGLGCSLYLSFLR